MVLGAGVGCWWRGRVHRVRCCWVGREVRGAGAVLFQRQLGSVGGREGITEGSCGNQSCSESLETLIFKSLTTQWRGQSPGPHLSFVRSFWDLRPWPQDLRTMWLFLQSPHRSWSSWEPFTPLSQIYDSSICSPYFIFNSRSLKASHPLVLPA